MDEREQVEYLKNELRNYFRLKKWIENDASFIDSKIEGLNKKIRVIDLKLSLGNARGIQYDYVPTTAVHEPLLSLFAEQEELVKERDKLIELKQQDLNGFKARVQYIEECLNKLDGWEKEFIIDYYCESITIYKLADKYPRSIRQLFRDKYYILKKMVN